ncbi:MAG: hypothetical protein SFV54_23300 [Bryobacteraceae bacterium]|nr:hypothetical protein [Bryobacteraceae bacterium]
MESPRTGSRPSLVTEIERRGEPRREASGPVWLLGADSAGRGITCKGRLLDESEHGFRARYVGSPFRSGAEIAFLCRKSAGRARVAWTRTDGGPEAESGFFILEKEENL